MPLLHLQDRNPLAGFRSANCILDYFPLLVKKRRIRQIPWPLRYAPSASVAAGTIQFRYGGHLRTCKQHTVR